MLSVHVAPSATANGSLEVYGAPPLSVVSSEQVIAEEMVESGCDGGDGCEGCGGGLGGGGGDGGGDGSGAG
eukprot:scaffold93638_cov54-Phaeocystis_antarctica.AAC.1